MHNNDADSHNLPAVGTRPRWVQAVVAAQVLAALLLLASGLQYVHVFGDCFAMATVLLAWSGGLWARKAIVRKASIVGLALALAGILGLTVWAFWPGSPTGGVRTRGGDPIDGWASGVMAVISLIFLSTLWLIVVPMMALPLWKLTRGKAAEYFNQPLLPIRFGLLQLTALTTLTAVGAWGFSAQIQSTGQIIFSQALDCNVRVYSPQQMGKRAQARMFSQSKRSRQANARDIYRTPEKVQLIVELLGSDDPEAARAGLELIDNARSLLRERRLARAVIDCTSLRDPLVRAKAIGCITRGLKPLQDDERALKVAAVGLRDPVAEVRREALTLLVALPSSAEDKVPLLLGSLDDSDPEVIAKSLTALESYPLEARKAQSEIRPSLTHSSSTVRQGAAVLLVELGERDSGLVPPLLQMLEESPDRAYSPQRDRAAFGLGELGALAAEAVPALTQAAAGGHRMSVRALGAIGAPARAAAPTLIDLLDTPTRSNSYIRSDAAEALGNIGPAASPAVPHLLASLNDRPQLPMIAEAPLALARIAPHDPSTLDALKEALTRQSTSGRHLSAVRALAELGPAANEARQELQQALTDADLHVRCHAAHVLWRLSPDDPAANTRWALSVDELAANIAADRYAAIHCASQIGRDAVRLDSPLLLKAQRPGVNQTAAIYALGKVAAPESKVMLALEELGQSDILAVRWAAADALEQLANCGDLCLP